MPATKVTMSMQIARQQGRQRQAALKGLIFCLTWIRFPKILLHNVRDHRAGTSDHPFSKPRARPASRASHCYATYVKNRPSRQVAWTTLTENSIMRAFSLHRNRCHKHNRQRHHMHSRSHRIRKPRKYKQLRSKSRVPLIQKVTRKQVTNRLERRTERKLKTFS